jgi:hypothetical protein
LQVAVVVLKGTSFVATPVIGSLIVAAAMALFAVILFRTSRAKSRWPELFWSRLNRNGALDS